jgi:hypothetical protein
LSFKLQRNAAKISANELLNKNNLISPLFRNIVSKTVLFSSVTLGEDKANDGGIIKIRYILSYFDL